MKIQIKNIFKRWLLLPFVAISTFCLTEISSNYPNLVEKYYSQNIYPFLAGVLSKASNIFPFSLDDIFYVLLILVAVLLVFLLIFKKVSLIKAGKLILNTLASVYILFYFLWGFNYFRAGLHQRIKLKEEQKTTDQFISVFEKLILETNQSYCTFENPDQLEIDSLIEQSYIKCAKALCIEYPSGKRKDKKITFSKFFGKAGISGYYGPFFNEVHVNKNVLPVEYPFVLAHEKAHQFGISSEAEANFYSWLVCTQSRSQQLRYSANLNILRYFMFQAYKLDEYSEIILKLDESVKADYLRIRENWMKLRNEKVDNVASKMNDTYLKTNKVEKGIQDYKGVVKFVLDFSLDLEFQNTHNLSTN